MRVLLFGSRSLTWKHLPMFRMLAAHAMLERPEDLAAWLSLGGVPQLRATLSGPLTLLNGDGPPGKERGAIGADKLALLACMEAWPAEQRRVRWFPPKPMGEETWPQAAGRRNREMVEARPGRVYCVHTNLDASKGSIMTASLLTAAGIPFHHIQATSAGAVVSVEVR